MYRSSSACSRAKANNHGMVNVSQQQQQLARVCASMQAVGEARNAERAAGQTAQDSTAYTYAGADQRPGGDSGSGSDSKGPIGVHA